MTEDADTRLSVEEQLGVSLSIVAGADSSTPTLGWIIAYLIQHPAWQERLYREIAEQIGSDSKDWPDVDEAQLPLVEDFIKEIMRCYPPLRSGIPRAAYHNVDYAGTTIPAKTSVVLNVWACNRGKLNGLHAVA